MSVPALAVQQPGIGVVSADNYNTYVQGGALLANLQNFPAVSSMTVYLLGYTAPGDGGQGFFYWNALSTATSNNTTVVAPNGLPQGRWIRIVNVNINIQPFRYITTGTTDTAGLGDQVIAWNVSTGGAKTETLPAAGTVPAGLTITVSDAYGDSAINHITIAPVSGTISFGASALINAKNMSLTFVSDGVSNWVEI